MKSLTRRIYFLFTVHEIPLQLENASVVELRRLLCFLGSSSLRTGGAVASVERRFVLAQMAHQFFSPPTQVAEHVRSSRVLPCRPVLSEVEKGEKKASSDSFTLWKHEMRKTWAQRYVWSIPWRGGRGGGQRRGEKENSTPTNDGRRDHASHKCRRGSESLLAGGHETQLTLNSPPTALRGFPTLKRACWLSSLSSPSDARHLYPREGCSPSRAGGQRRR